MENVISYLLPVVMGFVASWLQGRPFSKLDLSEKTKDYLNFGIAVLASIVAGVLSTVFIGELHGVEWTTTNAVANIGIVFAASQTSFITYFKNK